MSDLFTQHDTFVIERTYPASPERVFRAWSDREAKSRWFVAPDDWEQGEYELDFRVGGHERSSGSAPGGMVHSYDARYQDIVPDRRIVYTYEMHLDDRRISVSLATIELEPDGDGTRLTLTEQGVFLDGADDPAARRNGTGTLLDQLGEALRSETATA